MLTKSGSQQLLCSIPLRYDSYRGCEHGCKYCFASRVNKNGIKEKFYNRVEDGRINELNNFLKNQKLEKYLEGSPMHWGGMSDGFQPIEEERRISYKSLELLSEYQYPVVISTKGTDIITKNEYIDIIKKCKAVVQISIMNKNLHLYDVKAPVYKDRIKAVEKLLKNNIIVIIRMQPYMVHEHKSVMETIKELKGVYGIVVEGMKSKAKFAKGMVRNSGEYEYPIKKLMFNFIEIKNECSKYNIKFFVGENRLRWLGESVNCCGVDLIKGFEKKNNLNVSSLLFHEEITFRHIKKLPGKIIETTPAGRQDTLHSVARSRLNKKVDKNMFDDELKGESYGMYYLAEYFVNNGGFSNMYELMAVGKDEENNYIFEYKNRDVERMRKNYIKSANGIIHLD